MSMMDQINKWRGSKDRRRHEMIVVAHDFSRDAREFLEGLLDQSSTSNKLDQLFVKLSSMETELGIISQAVEGEGGITDLIRKVEKSMSTQEERLKTIQGQMTSIADGINKLQEQLAQLRINNPELEDEIAAMEATTKAIADDLNPPSEGGGTGGGTGEGGGVVNP